MTGNNWTYWDNIFKYQSIFFVYCLCLLDPMNGMQWMECKPNCSKPKVLTTFWFNWKRLFGNHAWNWSFNIVLILYKHLVNVFQKTHLWGWPAEFCHFWRFLSLLSLWDSLWAFNRHKFDYRGLTANVRNYLYRWVGYFFGMGCLQPWRLGANFIQWKFQRRGSAPSRCWALLKILVQHRRKVNHFKWTEW